MELNDSFINGETFSSLFHYPLQNYVHISAIELKIAKLCCKCQGTCCILIK